MLITSESDRVQLKLWAELLVTWQLVSAVLLNNR